MLLRGGLFFGIQIVLPTFVTDLGASLLGLEFIELEYFLFPKAGKRRGAPVASEHGMW